MHRFRVRVWFAAAVVALFLMAPGSALGAVEAIPEAPVLSPIAKAEILPFTLEGGGPIEVAVLTGSQTPGDATWTTTDELALSPYAGQTIRVLARAAGVSDEADWFDATYDVRDAYPSDRPGDATDPSVGIDFNSSQVKAYASSLSDYHPGPNVGDGWKARYDPLQPGLTILGDRGSVQAHVRSPIVDGPGADFAVYENGFTINNSDLSFLELAYVEVSSDGTDFVRFSSASRTADPVGGFSGMKGTDIGGLAGKDIANYGTNNGTPFDLTTLRNTPAVRSGTVDLNDITSVRIVDVAGDGNDLDSFGRPIYDPYPTTDSGGFDFTGLGVINQAAQVAWIAVPTASDLAPTSAKIATKVNANGYGAVSLAVELSEAEDHADARTVATGSASASATRQARQFQLEGLTPQRRYWYRVVGTSAGSGQTTATDWQSFVAPLVQITKPTVPIQDKVGTGAEGTVSAEVQFAVNPFGGADQGVRVEYSPNADYSGAVSTPAMHVAGEYRTPVYLRPVLDGLTEGFEYFYRVVSEDDEGRTVATDWQSFTARPTDSSFPMIEPLLSVGEFSYRDGEVRAHALVSFRPGVKLKARLRLERFDADSNSIPMDDPPPVTIDNPTGVAEVSLDLHVPDVSADAFHNLMLTIEPEDGSSGTSQQIGGYAIDGSGPATLGAPTTDAVTATSTHLSGTLTRHTGGSQRVRVEYTSVAAPGDVRRTAPVLFFWDQYDSEGEKPVDGQIEGLLPETGYRARIVSESVLDGSEATSDWVDFTTATPADALGATALTGTTADAATVSAHIDAGEVDRMVSVEYQPVGQDGDPAATPATTVAAGTPAGDVALAVPGLSPGTTYRWRVVARAGGHLERGEWGELTTRARPTEPGASVGDTPTPTPGPSPGAAVPATTPAATLSPAKLRLSVPAGPFIGGARVAVTGAGLAAGEKYVLTLDGTRVAAGNADGAGRVRATIRIPGSVAAGTRALTLTGSSAARRGRVMVRIVAAATLRVSVQGSVAPGDRQRVTVTGLAPGEPVSVRYRGRRVSGPHAHADADGTYEVRFGVGRGAGTRTVRVTGVAAGRSGTATFAVGS